MISHLTIINQSSDHAVWVEQSLHEVNLSASSQDHKYHLDDLVAHVSFRVEGHVVCYLLVHHEVLLHDAQESSQSIFHLLGLHLVLLSMLSMKFLSAFSLSQIVLRQHRNELSAPGGCKIKVVAMPLSGIELKSDGVIAVLVVEHHPVILVDGESYLLSLLEPAIGVCFTLIPVNSGDSFNFHIVIYFYYKRRLLGDLKGICFDVLVVDVERLDLVSFELGHLIGLAFFIVHLLPIYRPLNHIRRLSNTLIKDSFV